MKRQVSVWLPGLPQGQAFLVGVTDDPVFVGVIEIRTAREPDRKPVIDRYAVREEPLPDTEDRRFKLTKRGGEEWYYVLVDSADVPHDQCECRDFDKHGVCKHITALRTLCRAGAMECRRPF